MLYLSQGLGRGLINKVPLPFSFINFNLRPSIIIRVLENENKLHWKSNHLDLKVTNVHELKGLSPDDGSDER
jgi:hypothetical protein